MPRVVVAMLGARMHYAVPRLLHEAGLLERFYTDSYVGNKPWLGQILRTIPVSLRPREIKQWLGRADLVLPPEKVTSFERLGFWYAIARRRAASVSDMERVFTEAAVWFSECVGPEGLQRANILWGFNSASLELFHAAKAKGIRCILEQTILPYRLMHKLLQEEEERWPGWSIQHGRSINESVLSLADTREEQEWKLADRIVVGSNFVRSGLLELDVPDEKISVVPYGVDTSRFPVSPTSEFAIETRPLRVLFAGEVGLRKGLPDLLHALHHLPPSAVEVRLAGAVSLAGDKLERWRDQVAFLGTVPRSEMRKLYQWADVFVLPSIVEGSATVTYEALMSGVPVIATPNTGSLVRDGVDGFLIPIRSAEALAGAILRYHQDRTLLARHRAATKDCRKMAGLDRYRSDLVRLVYNVLGAEL